METDTTRCLCCNTMFIPEISWQEICLPCAVYERVSEHSGKLHDEAMELERKRGEIKEPVIM